MTPYEATLELAHIIEALISVARAQFADEPSATTVLRDLSHRVVQLQQQIIEEEMK